MPKGSIKIEGLEGVELTQKRVIWNKNNSSLIDQYIKLFELGMNIYKTPEFDSVRLQVINTAHQIKSKFNVDIIDVCEFAFKYHEFTDLLNGVFMYRQSDHLYFIESNDHIKIGRTSDLRTRMYSLQLSNPDKLKYKQVFYGRGYCEFDIHKIFDYLRVNGEWFQKHNDIYEFISLLENNNSNIKSKHDYDKYGKTISQSIIYKGTELIYT